MNDTIEMLVKNYGSTKYQEFCDYLIEKGHYYNDYNDEQLIILMETYVNERDGNIDDVLNPDLTVDEMEEKCPYDVAI